MRLTTTQQLETQRGFTLIEVMLSISVLALIMAIAWGSYSSAVSNQQRMRDINNRLHGVEQAINRMVREFSMAFITPFEEDTDKLEIRYVTGFYGTSDRVDFTSFAHVRMFRDDKVGDQCELSYYVKRMKNDDGKLVSTIVRRIDAPIDDDPQKGGIVIPLLEDVERFELEYWDDEKAEMAVGGDGWVSEWDSESEEFLDRLPSRIRITVEIKDPVGRDKIRFTTQAELHLTSALDF